jgi:hypothetical protein
MRRRTMLKFQPLNLNDRILVLHENGKCLGDLCREVDGCFYWYPSPECQQGGCWDSHVLREIADKLTDLNHAWDQQVQNGLGELAQQAQELDLEY